MNLVIVMSCSYALRAAETRTGTGVITGKTFKAAAVYKSYSGGKDGAFSGSREIPVASCVVFEIKVKGVSGTTRYSLNTIAAAEYEVGQKVEIEYVKREIVPLQRRIYVRSMRPAK